MSLLLNTCFDSLSSTILAMYLSNSYFKTYAWQYCPRKARSLSVMWTYLNWQAGRNLLDMTTLMIRSLAAGRRAQASPQLGNMIGLPRSTGMDLGAENPSSLQAPGRANRLHT